MATGQNRKKSKQVGFKFVCFLNRNSQGHILNGLAFCLTTAEKDTEENIIKA